MNEMNPNRIIVSIKLSVIDPIPEPCNFRENRKWLISLHIDKAHAMLQSSLPKRNITCAQYKARSSNTSEVPNSSTSEAPSESGSNPY
ncbi:hypothetical protein QVD17_03919 [Tagetes erecta]|uniref:Uncharacterized protein n=1 Tax=Tagetes erecta TaxID=13708 RepID=A0AAD8LFK8_TARER|nr:hypothetical protein QVD17_03919 [Tagetes erecta]